MANLIWQRKGKVTKLLPTPFKSEEAFEKAVFKTPEILDDVFLLTRQVRGTGRAGIPDMVGIGNDGSVCIVEMKNTTVDAAIVPQVLKYAIWAETNPDSIKSMWLECADSPDDISVDWDNFQVRIIVIAPTILRSTLNVVGKINYQVDLIEVQRWIEGENHLLLVNRLEQVPPPKRKSARGLQQYDEDFYSREYNSASARQFVRYCKQVEALVKKNKWSLERKFNKHYCGFKAGFFNAFGVEWVGTKTFAFYFKLTKREAQSVKKPRMTRYQTQWKQAMYYIEPGVTTTADFQKLFEMAYRKLTGK